MDVDLTTFTDDQLDAHRRAVLREQEAPAQARAAARRSLRHGA